MANHPQPCAYLPLPAWHFPYKTRESLEVHVEGLNLSNVTSFNEVFQPVRGGNAPRFNELRKDRKKSLEMIKNIVEHEESGTEEEDGSESGDSSNSSEVSAASSGDISSQQSSDDAEEPVNVLEQRYLQHGWFVGSSSSSSKSSKSSSSTTEVPPLPETNDDRRDKFGNIYVYKNRILGGTKIGWVNHWRVVVSYYNKHVIMEAVPHHGFLTPMFTIEEDKPSVGTKFTFMQSGENDGFRQLPNIKRVKTSPCQLLAIAKQNPLNGYLYIPLLADCQSWVEYASDAIQEWGVE